MTDIYKQFRTIEKIASKYTLSKRFDEPTYFSFRLLFGSDSDSTYNYAGTRAIYDTMPHPLFNKNTDSQLSSDNTVILLNDQNTYSAIQYLIDANEPTRAEMMKEFIAKFNSLQNDFPYYFQSIDGLSSLLKIDPTKGQRLPNDTKITITCLEGIDLRISYLLNLYRKIAWDDVYQRWVLPDMMRYFTLKIYLSEFRTFHLPQTNTNMLNGYGEYAIAGTQPTVDAKQSTSLNMADKYANQLATTTQNAAATTNGTEVPLFLSILDDVLPTWELKCEMCEFDLTDIDYDHVGNLNVAEPTQGAVKFSIKVGNVYELQTYPVFQHMFMDDKILNGTGRAKDDITTAVSSYNKYHYPASLQMGQFRDPASDSNTHIPTMPYNERRNQNTVSQAKMSSAENTWLGNAIDTASAYVSNLAETVKSKATTTAIPGIGASISEITSALESKDIVSVIGTIRKAVTTVVNEYQTPSSHLSGEITSENIMKEFLTKLANSTATDEASVKLQQAAINMLNDNNLNSKISNDFKSTIKDEYVDSKLSEAKFNNNTYTNSPINVTDKINRPDSSEKLSGEISEKTNNESASVRLSGKIDEKLQTETASSHLTNFLTDNKVIRPNASEKLTSDITKQISNSATASEMLTGTINKYTNNDMVEKSETSIEKGMTVSASSKLDGNLQKDIKQPEASSEIKNIQVTNIIEFTPSSTSKTIISGITQPEPGQAMKNKIIKSL
jgi:hypothetical protein